MSRTLTIQYDFFFRGCQQFLIAEQSRFCGHEVRQVAYTLCGLLLNLHATHLKRQSRWLYGVLQGAVTIPLELREPLLVGELIQHNGAPRTQTRSNRLNASNLLECERWAMSHQ